MDVWDLRADLTPLKPGGAPGRHPAGEYALEDTGDRLGADASYGEIGYDFAGTLPWAPYLAYRYARSAAVRARMASPRTSIRSSPMPAATVTKPGAPGSRARSWANG